MLNFDQSFAADCPSTSSNPEPAAQNITTPASPAHLPLGLLQAVLNQVDYGLAVVDAQSHRLIFANVQAQSALQAGSTQGSGLCVAHGFLRARDSQHAEALSTALAKTATRVRGLLRLGGSGSEQTVAIMPLAGFVPATGVSQIHPTDADDDEYDYVDAHNAPAQASSLALLVFAKQQLCDTTTVTLFARESGLTSAEGQVLAQVCKGLRPAQIATHQGVQVSTVRTQLRAIRHKTASDSMRELVRKVSTLPPVARYLPSFLGGVDSGFAA
jgi:DNA-binding CsgD family transcriptional regulator